MDNLYKILAIQHDATTDEIKSALTLKYHLLPTTIIEAVRHHLLNPEQRLEYDAQLQQHDPEFFQQPPSPLLKLWNPNVAAALGLLSPILAMWIHAQNWKTLGNPTMATKNMVALYCTVIFVLVILLCDMLMNSSLLMGINIVPLVLWFLMLGHHQTSHIKEHYNYQQYQPKSWLMPLLIGVVACRIIIFIIAMILSTTLDKLGMLHPDYWQ